MKEQSQVQSMVFLKHFIYSENTPCEIVVHCTKIATEFSKQLLGFGEDQLLRVESLLSTFQERLQKPLSSNSKSLFVSILSYITLCENTFKDNEI